MSKPSNNSEISRSQQSAAIHKFLEDLCNEELHLKEIIEKHDYRVVLFGCVRELDFWDMLYRQKEGEVSEQEKIQRSFFNYGIPIILRIIFSKINRLGKYSPLFESDNQSIMFFSSLLGKAGHIEFGRRLAHLAIEGLCEIKKDSENFYEIIFSKEMSDPDSYEREMHVNFISSESSKVMSSLLPVLQKHKEQVNIEGLLSENVFKWREHFIGYTPHPILDDYFFCVAYSYAFLFTDFDTFHFSVKFGNVSFQKYRLALVLLISLAIKHEAYCAALVKKDRSIRYENILTITKERKEIILTLIEGINQFGSAYEGFSPMTRKEANTILNVLSLSKQNISSINGTGSPIPPFIDFTINCVISSLAAVHRDPFVYLLKSLKCHFPKDYDRNQRTREEAMCKAIQRVMKEIHPNLKFWEGIKIKEEGQVVTDIDLVAWNPTEESIIFFQLKHQDTYGTDMKRRRNISTKLEKEVPKWLSRVQNWIDKKTADQIKASLQLKSSTPLNKEKIFKIIIAKNHSHFVEKCTISENTAFATWSQFCAALGNAPGDRETMGHFFSDTFQSIKQSMKEMARNKIGPQDEIRIKMKNIVYTVKTE